MPLLYDRHPTYPHHAHLPFSHEPLKAIYVLYRLLTTLLLVPFWLIYYLLAPYNKRPRPSWSLRQILLVNFTRRIFKVTEVAGVTWGTHRPDEEPAPGKLRETRFMWVDPLPAEFRTGIVLGDPEVPFVRVGVFVWPRNATRSTDALDANGPRLVGIFMHGGGYCHMSAHETARTSRIPRRLMQNSAFLEIYAVEYRLLQYAPFPAVIQDAAAVYSHVVQRYRHGPENHHHRIVLIGDSSGGNLALALARWVRDEGKLPLPEGLLLFSPSCDPSHAFPRTPSSYIPRPHGSIDYLVDTPEPRALLQRTFLGFGRRHHNHHWPMCGGSSHVWDDDEEYARLLRVVHSEYVSPASAEVLLRHGHVVQNHNGEEEVPLVPTMLPPVTLAEGEEGRGRRLFGGFPRTLVVLGTHERLVKEVESLTGAMERDDVRVEIVWVRDAVHDVFIFAEGWWDEGARREAWAKVEVWVESLRVDGEGNGGKLPEGLYPHSTVV